MPEYQRYLDEIEGLKRSLSLSEITQEEYNKKVNEAKGALLTAADAAKIGGSEVEHLRAEFGNDSWRTTIDNIQTANDALKAYNQTLEDIKNSMFYSSFDSENGLWEDRDMNRDYMKEMKKEFDDAADSIAICSYK